MAKNSIQGCIINRWRQVILVLMLVVLSVTLIDKVATADDQLSAIASTSQWVDIDQSSDASDDLIDQALLSRFYIPFIDFFPALFSVLLLISLSLFKRRILRPPLSC
jgi:hypothetical protein